MLLPPPGYLHRLEAAILDLVETWFWFKQHAPDDVQAAKDAFSAIAERTDADNGLHDHDLHMLIAQWAIETAEQSEGTTRPEIDIGSIWSKIEHVLGEMILDHGIDPAGTIYGFQDFENLDPGWLGYIEGWLRHAPSIGKGTAPGQAGTVIPIADETTIAIVGDWGTGTDYPTQTAGAVADTMYQLGPEVAIHLGDVYYAGTLPQEAQRFIDPWNTSGLGTAKSFNLNSNHDMYGGAVGYDWTLTQPPFRLQHGQGHFALENSHWVIVGLDTAWPASWDYQYMFGALDPGQLAFLTDQARKGKQLIVLTHHQGLMQESGDPNRPLYDDVTAAVNRGNQGDAVWYWYWGHIHAGYVHTRANHPFLGRCAGHGAIPWGYSSELDALTKGPDPKVEWFEQRKNPVGDHQVMNGFALLDLSGPDLTEKFVDQTGVVGWRCPPDAG